MLLNDLFEDASLDIEMRSVVAKVANRIMARLYEECMPDRVVRTPGGIQCIYEPKTLGIENALPAILVLMSKHHGPMTGAVADLKHRPEHCVIVYCLDDDFDPTSEDGSSFRRLGGSMEFSKVLKHEITHCFDNDRTNDAIHKGSRHPDPANTDRQKARKSFVDYYNCGPELNAYFHDISGPFAEVNDEIKQAGSRAEAMEILSACGYTGVFQHDLKEIMRQAARSSKSFLAAVSPENSRKLLLRLYRMHGEIMGRINNLPA